MGRHAITGDDTFLLNGTRTLKNFVSGSVIDITFDNDRVSLDTGKDGNTIFAINKQGQNATAVLRILRGSDDDKYLNSLSIQQDNDPIGFTLLFANFTKRIGDGNGNITYDKYVLQGGMFQKIPDGQENNAGETEQGIVEYTIVFAKGERVLA